MAAKIKPARELWGPRYYQSYKAWDPPKYNNKLKYPVYDTSYEGDDWEHSHRHGYQLGILLTRDVAGYMGLTEQARLEKWGPKVDIQQDKLIGLLNKPFVINSKQSYNDDLGNVAGYNDIKKSVTLSKVFQNLITGLNKPVNNANINALNNIVSQGITDILAIMANSNDKLDQLLPIPIILNQMKGISAGLNQAKTALKAPPLTTPIKSVSKTTGITRKNDQLSLLDNWKKEIQYAIDKYIAYKTDLSKTVDQYVEIANDPNVDQKDQKEAEEKQNTINDDIQKTQIQVGALQQQLIEIDNSINEINNSTGGIAKGRWGALQNKYGKTAPAISDIADRYGIIEQNIQVKIKELQNFLQTLISPQKTGPITTTGTTNPPGLVTPSSVASATTFSTPPTTSIKPPSGKNNNPPLPSLGSLYVKDTPLQLVQKDNSLSSMIDVSKMTLFSDLNNTDPETLEKIYRIGVSNANVPSARKSFKNLETFIKLFSTNSYGLHFTKTGTLYLKKV